MNFKWPVVRDVILFFGGLGGVLHETLITNTDRPTLVILFAAMMGLPAFFQPKAPGPPSPPSPPSSFTNEQSPQTTVGGLDDGTSN